MTRQELIDNIGNALTLLRRCEGADKFVTTEDGKEEDRFADIVSDLDSLYADMEDAEVEEE